MSCKLDDLGCIARQCRFHSSISAVLLVIFIESQKEMQVDRSQTRDAPTMLALAATIAREGSKRLPHASISLECRVPYKATRPIVPVPRTTPRARELDDDEDDDSQDCRFLCTLRCTSFSRNKASCSVTTSRNKSVFEAFLPDDSPSWTPMTVGFPLALKAAFLFFLSAIILLRSSTASGSVLGRFPLANSSWISGIMAHSCVSCSMQL